jgi:hypothetical protein
VLLLVSFCTPSRSSSAVVRVSSYVPFATSCLAAVCVCVCSIHRVECGHVSMDIDIHTCA